MEYIPPELEEVMHHRTDRKVMLKIATYASRGEPVCVTEVAKAVKTTDVTAGKHLDMLVRAGMLKTKRVGYYRVYYR